MHSWSAEAIIKLYIQTFAVEGGVQNGFFWKEKIDIRLIVLILLDLCEGLNQVKR